MLSRNIDSLLRTNISIWKETSVCEMTFSLEQYRFPGKGIFPVKFLLKKKSDLQIISAGGFLDHCFI